MAIQQIEDVTNDFNDGGSSTLDIGGWDFVVVQLVAPVGTTSFFTSNDSGAVQGVSDGNATSADNFIAVSGTNLATAAGATTLAAAGLIKFTGVGRYLRITGTSAGKVIIRMYKSF